MGHTTFVIVGLVVMVALIVGLDVAFLRDRFTARLITNVAIVVVFALIYLLVRNHLG